MGFVSAHLELHWRGFAVTLHDQAQMCSFNKVGRSPLLTQDQKLSPLIAKSLPSMRYYYPHYSFIAANGAWVKTQSWDLRLCVRVPRASVRISQSLVN